MTRPTWWSEEGAEFLTLSEEHAATGGDHFGTVQTGCPICAEIQRLREERDPPLRDPEDVKVGSAHV